MTEKIGRYYRLPQELVDKLEQHFQTTKVPINSIIIIAVEQFFDRKENQIEQK